MSLIKDDKKVVIIIAEGASDEEALYPFLKDLGKPHNIKFEITRGDILSDFKNTKKSHKTIIGDIVSTIINKNRFLKKDVLLVAQLTDTDGVFIEDDKVVIDSSIDRISYRDGEIAVNNSGKQSEIIERNKQKVLKIQALVNMPFTLTSIPYKIYYFSCNLDHVLHGEQLFGVESKMNKAEEFSNSMTSMGFKDFLKDKAIYGDKGYDQSWDFIYSGDNSLKRCTNFGLFLNEVE